MSMSVVYSSFVRHAVVSLASVLLAGTAFGASFDCTKARTSVEQAICLDAGVSKQDETMATLFSKALKDSSNPSLVRQSQRDWLRLVRNRCDSRECLVSAYEERIRRLRDGRAQDLSATPAGAFSSADGRLAPGEVDYLPGEQDFEQKLVPWIRGLGVVEEAMEVAARYVPKRTLPSVVLRHCAAQAGFGAYYTEAAHQVHVCYEFVTSLIQTQDQLVKGGQSNWDAEQPLARAAIKFLVWHEAAHALLRKSSDGGTVGPEEAEADNIAGVLLLAHTTSEEQTRQAVLGVRRLVTVFGPRATYTDTEYADEHLLPQQRFAAISCLAVGRQPALVGWLGQILPARRAAQCQADWPKKLSAVNALLKRVR